MSYPQWRRVNDLRWYYYTQENFKLILEIRPLFRVAPLAKIKLQMYKLRLEKT